LFWIVFWFLRAKAATVFGTS